MKFRGYSVLVVLVTLPGHLNTKFEEYPGISGVPPRISLPKMSENPN
jgi:hypothetical protein